MYKKDIAFLRYFFVANILSIIAIMIFFISECPNIFNAVFNETSLSDLFKVNLWKFIGCYFFCLATTSMKTELYNIFKGLKVRNSSFMNKFINLSFHICWFVYPGYAIQGYYIFRNNELVKDGK